MFVVHREPIAFAFDGMLQPLHHVLPVASSDEALDLGDRIALFLHPEQRQDAAVVVCVLPAHAHHGSVCRLGSRRRGEASDGGLPRLPRQFAVGAFAPSWAVSEDNFGPGLKRFSLLCLRVHGVAGEAVAGVCASAVRWASAWRHFFAP